MRRATGYDNKGGKGRDPLRKSRKDFDPSNPFQHRPKASNNTAIIADKAKYNEYAEIEETTEGYSIPHTRCQPRQSTTNKQMLRIFSQKVETEDMREWHLSSKSDGELLAVTSPRVTWRSDRTLLDRRKSDPILQVKRETAYSKRLKTETERDINTSFDQLVILIRLLKSDNRIVVVATASEIHPKYGIVLT